MATGNGWYLIGPLIAVGLVCFLGLVFWRMGLQWTLNAADDDYGLLRPAAVAVNVEAAEEIREMLADAGIRATLAETTVLVFAEDLEEARRALKVV
jgi:hypothetical protein